MNEQLNKISRVHCSVNHHRLRSLFRAGVLGAVGMLWSIFAPVHASAGVVVYYSFNNTGLLDGTAAGTNAFLAADTGSSISTFSNFNPLGASFTTPIGSTLNAQPGFPAGTAVSQGGWHSNAVPAYFQFTFNGTGLQSNIVSFWEQKSPTGPSSVDFQYSTNGGASFITFATLIASNFPGNVHTQDVSGVTGLYNNPNDVFRIQGNNATGTGGTFRIDNITIDTASPPNSWISGNGKWETATNWSLGSAPGSVDSADLITNAGNNTVTIDATTAGSFPATMTINNLIISTNTLQLTNAIATTFRVLSQLNIASSGTLRITNSDVQVDGVSGGSLIIDGRLALDSGSIVVTNAKIYIGNTIGGSAQMTVSNGTVLAGVVLLPNFSGIISNTSTLTIAGGSMSATNMVIGGGNANNGILTVTNGTLAVTNAAHTASFDFNAGTLTLLAGGSILVDSFIITNAQAHFSNLGGAFIVTGPAQVNQGTVTISGGTAQTQSNLVIGATANSTGTVSVTGGTLVVTNGVLGIGNDGTTTNGFGVGQMTVSNATVLASTILLGSTAGGRGSLTIQSGGVVSLPGSNSLLSVNSLTVLGGALPVGVLDIVNGTIKVGVVSNGTMTVSGGIANCADVIIGEDTLGTCRMNDGTMTMVSVLTVGNGSASTGVIWMNGGTWLSSSRATIGNNGTGQMTISNGTITLPRVVVSGIGTSANPGTFTIAGGAAYCTNLVVGFDVNSTGTVWVTGGELDVTNVAANAPLVVGRLGRGVFTLSNGTVVVDQLLVTNLTKSTFTFVGGTLKTRNTTVASGVQFVAGDGVSLVTLSLLGGSHSFANGLKISINAALVGSGAISGTVVNFGLIFPGNGVLTFGGIVTNNGAIAATAGSTINFNGQVVNNGLIFTNSAIHFNAGLINNATLVDADGDPDHDGFTNLEEYEANTDPNDPTSTPFCITSIVQQGSDLLITWTTAGGKTNVVQATTGASGSYSNNFIDISPIIVPTGSDLTSTNYLDSGAATNFPARYYRIRLTP